MPRVLSSGETVVDTRKKHASVRSFVEEMQRYRSIFDSAKANDALVLGMKNLNISRELMVLASDEGQQQEADRLGQFA
jgi:hypothetical protein